MLELADTLTLLWILERICYDMSKVVDRRLVLSLKPIFLSLDIFTYGLESFSNPTVLLLPPRVRLLPKPGFMIVVFDRFLDIFYLLVPVSGLWVSKRSTVTEPDALDPFRLSSWALLWRSIFSDMMDCILMSLFKIWLSSSSGSTGYASSPNGILLIRLTQYSDSIPPSMSSCETSTCRELLCIVCRFSNCLLFLR